MANSLIAPVICIPEPFHPAGWQAFCINRITMVLACDKALLCSNKLCRLVLASMTIFQLISVGACSQCKNLVSKADSKGWNFLLQCFGSIPDCCLHCFWVAGTVD